MRAGFGLRASGFGLVMVLAAGVARAGNAKVDWASGLITAEGLGLADRHAPDPAVARGTAKRPAEHDARAQLRAAALALPVAGGGKVADRASDPAVKARLDRAIGAAFEVAAEPETDGSWHVTLALPIEAVRQALAGPRALPAAGDSGPPVVVVDGVSAAPAVGYKLGDLEAATLWVKAPPPYAAGAPHVHARHSSHGAITVDGMQGTAATLFVIVKP